MLSLLLAVPSCIYSFWHGVIPTSYFIFNDLYILQHVIMMSLMNVTTEIGLLKVMSVMVSTDVETTVTNRTVV